MTSTSKKLGIAILGYGVVGSGTYKILKERKDAFSSRYGVDAEVLYVMEKFQERAIKDGVPKQILTQDIQKIVQDPAVTTVVDCIGGIEPVKSYLSAALEAGKNVVTANKELLSKHFAELEIIAKAHNAGLYFEASCGGGIPVIRTLNEAMQANEILELKGIVNGTTNFILTKMAAEGADYAAVLKEAQALGYAEANPSADVDGFDAAYKLSILGTLAFGLPIPVEAVYREGIGKVTLADIRFGQEFGYTLKLLAIGKRRGAKIEARVHPVFIPDSHPMAAVAGSFNAVYIVGDNVGEIMLYGRGAGSLPTGSAVVSDIIFSAKQNTAPRFEAVLQKRDSSKFIKNFESEYYLRVSAYDKPGVLAEIARIFAENNVSIVSMHQKGVKSATVPIIFMTHKTSEKNMQTAVALIEKLKDKVLGVDALIRVEAA